MQSLPAIAGAKVTSTGIGHYSIVSQFNIQSIVQTRRPGIYFYTQVYYTITFKSGLLNSTDNYLIMLSTQAHNDAETGGDPGNGSTQAVAVYSRQTHTGFNVYV